MNVKIAKENKEQGDAFRIRETVFVQEQKVPPEEELDQFDKTATHFVGYEDGIPIAASRLRFIDDSGKLERICVLKPHRLKSYGKQIIKAMEEEILNNDYSQAKLNAQTHATTFYEQLGYEIISEEFIDAGIPHVTMVKNLKDRNINL